jgi:hypothetical protein
MQEYGPSHNPYQSSSLPPQREPILEYELSEVIASLARWQTYLSLLGLLLAGLTLVGIVSSLVFGTVSSVIMSGLVVFFLLLPSVVLFRAAAKAKSFARENHESLQEVLVAQRGFWRLMGMSATVVILFYGLILSAILVAAMARM